MGRCGRDTSEMRRLAARHRVARRADRRARRHAPPAEPLRRGPPGRPRLVRRPVPARAAGRGASVRPGARGHRRGGALRTHAGLRCRTKPREARRRTSASDETTRQRSISATVAASFTTYFARRSLSNTRTGAVKHSIVATQACLFFPEVCQQFQTVPLCVSESRL